MAKQKRFNKFGNFGIQSSYKAIDCAITRQNGDNQLNDLNLAKTKLAELDEMKNLYPFERKIVNSYKKNLIRRHGILNYHEIERTHTMHEDCVKRHNQASEKSSTHLSKEMIDKLRIRLHKMT